MRIFYKRFCTPPPSRPPLRLGKKKRRFLCTLPFLKKCKNGKIRDRQEKHREKSRCPFSTFFFVFQGRMRIGARRVREAVIPFSRQKEKNPIRKEKIKSSKFFVQNAKNTRYRIFGIDFPQDMVYNRCTHKNRAKHRVPSAGHEKKPTQEPRPMCASIMKKAVKERNFRPFFA